MQAVQYMNINLFYLCVKVKIRGEGLSALTNRGRDISVSVAACGVRHTLLILQRKTGRLYLPETEKKQEIIRSLFQKKGDYSAVFANNSDKPKKYSICVRNIEKADALLFTVLRQKGPESCDNYSVNWFRLVDKIIPVKKNYGFVYTLEVKAFFNYDLYNAFSGACKRNLYSQKA